MKATPTCNLFTLFRLYCIILIGLVSIVTSHAHGNNSLSYNGGYVLIINAYTSNTPWSNVIIEPVQRWMSEERRAVFVEHMNMLMVDNAQDFAKIENSMLSRYETRAPKLVLMLGNPSLLMRKEVRKRWADVPIILCGEHDFAGPDNSYIERHSINKEDRISMSDIAKEYNLTFLQTKIFTKENIDLLKYMIPGIKEVVLIGDGGYINQQLNYDMEQLVAQQYPDLEYKFLSEVDMTLEQLLSKLQTIDTSRTGVFFYSWFSKLNVDGHIVINTNSFHRIANIAVPVFSLNHSVIHNSGMVGGYFYDNVIFMNNLREAITSAIDEPQLLEPKLFIPDKAIPVFNYPSLLINNFSESQCPKDSKFLYRPKTFYEEYKYFILFGGFILSISLFIALMFYRISTLNAINKAQKQQFDATRELTKLFENMPIAYMKAKLIRNGVGDTIDFEICRTNGRFMTYFIKEKRHEKYNGSDLWGSDLARVMRFMKLADSEHRTITYTQYFTTANVYLNVVVTPAMQQDYIDAYYVDDTELYNTQQRLNDTNRKLAMTLDVANIVPWIWNLHEHKILCDVNRSTVLSDTMQSLDDDKLLVDDTQYFSKILKEDKERVEQAYNGLIEGRTNKVQEEYRIVVCDNDKYKIDWVEVQATVEQRDTEGKPITLVGSSQVITRRKKMEQDLITARDKAEESNRLKSAFLANMSHEIRTPLNAIVGFSGLLNSMDELEEREEYVKIIENNNELLLQLIGDILDLSKIEAGALEFVDSSVCINDMMDETAKILQLRAKEKGLTIVFKDYLPECNILVDRNRLSQVLMNLITNAIKFTDKGGVTIGYTLQAGNMLRFYVADTGCGISPERHDDVFERFVKLNSFAQGTGLGLPICRTIIDKMGGKIGVESEPGKGSIFWFTIKNNSSERVSKPIQEFTVKAVAKSDVTILIAEDNISNFKLFETILQKDYKIIHAWNGVEAVDLFKKHNPHIVLMDINMPVMNGYEATDEIRKLSANVPILAVTAYAYATAEQQILDHGFDGYTPKPINPKVLKTKIIDLLNMRLVLL